MQCPFCKVDVGNQDELQLHCLVCTTAYAEPRTSSTEPSVDSVVVRFRWVKSRPCFAREIHLISSLAGSVLLHWKEDEGLYESDTISVPVGEHICQLAVGGDVVPTEPFEVNEDSDVIFVIVGEDSFVYPVFDRSVATERLSLGVLQPDDDQPDPVDASDRYPRPLDMESRSRGNANEISPLYRELLQHQLSHGEPSWVPGSGVQSPVISDSDLSALAGQQDEESSTPGTPPDHREQFLPGLDIESRSVDLSGESDGVCSLADGGGVNEQSDNEEENVIPQLSSLSPVPSSHSENVTDASRDSPLHSPPGEGGARDVSVISPLIVEAVLRQSPHPIARDPSGEEQNLTPPSSPPQSTSVRDLDRAEGTDNLRSTTEEHPVEHIQSAPRASPLGSVHDALPVPTSSEPDTLLNDHMSATPPQRYSPTGSVQSSSVFSSGLPSPIMSPRGRSHSDTGIPLVSRGSPPGSVRPQSLGGTVPSTARLVTTLRSPHGPVSGTELSPVSTAERHSPSGATHANRARPQERIEMMDSPQEKEASRHSSQTVLSTHGGSALVSPVVGQTASEYSTASVLNPRHQTSDAGSPTELLLETAHRQATPPVASRSGLSPPTPDAPLSTFHRESEHTASSENSARNRISGAGRPTETTYRQEMVGSPPEVPSGGPRHHGRGHSTPLANGSRHGASDAQSPSELFSETMHTLLTSRGSRSKHEGEKITSLGYNPLHRKSGTGSSSETPLVSSQSCPSRVSTRQSPASSFHIPSELSPPRVSAPPLPHESVIPSRGSAFAAVTGDRGSHSGLSSEMEMLREERDSLSRELRQRAAHYEAELRRVKSRNEDLEQQMLSIETVATLTKHDDDKTRRLEQTVLDLNTTLQEKDQQIRVLQESIQGLEKTNTQLKDEQESLKTVNQLQLEDMNRFNSDLQQQLSDLRRRSAESARAQRNRDEGKIIELQMIQNTLEQRLKRLERENTNLHKQLHQAQQGMETMRVGTKTSDSRISKAKSETDLSRKFHKYTAYDERKYRDLEPVVKAATFSTRGGTSGLGSTRFSSLHADYTRSHDFSVPSRVLTNGCGSEARTAGVSSYYTVEDRLASHEPVINRITVPRHRVGSLGEDSDASDDLEHTSQPRWRAQSAESSSSIASWDHDYSAYSPASSRYQRDDRSVGSRRRPHSYHGGSVRDIFRGKDDYSPSQHVKSSPYSQSQRDIGRHSTSSSQLLSSTSHQPTSTKLFTKPFAPTSSTDIQLGMEVLVTRSRGQIGRGKVKYVGPLPGRPDTYIGIELKPGQEGKHDGSLNGHRLFSCEPKRGIFVSFNKVVMCYG